ncbi:hypothetical protein H0E87_022751 [Populus deltoides]|uniref:Uncharacterized protein n=1 Tax=Populus deltoides TaxID=3696 RepID=A0A8T2XCF2_POPDE|nr:hypothetical protein H0E87_022751 [Populus deltoides]
MQVVPREGESALSVSGPRPMEWSTKFNPDGNVIASGSHDKEIFLWYIHGECKNLMVMRGHKNAVLDLHWTTDGGAPLVVSGSDYGTAKLWEMRPKGAIQTFPDKYQITAASFSDISDKIFTGVIDNDIKVRDIRKGEVTMTLEGHQDMITGMQLSPDGSYLLMNGMDNKLCIWDMRPFAPQNRCVKIFEEHQHNNFEKNL